MTDRPLLEMRAIGKSFAGVRALNGVSLTVRGGQVVALLGENGAGKSTLINVLSGVFSSYEGEILMDGEPVSLHTPTAAQRLGISTIHQELNLVPDMSIADNIWLGREQSTAGWVQRRRTVESAAQLLARVGLDVSPRRLVRQCRLAEQQLIEVAKAISMNTRVLIMDEPTSALADSEVQRLFEVVRSLKAAGVGIIYISHRLEELDEIADTVNVLRDGVWIGERKVGEAGREELVRMMVGRPVSELHRRPDDEQRTIEDRPRLTVSHLSLIGDARESRAALHDVSLSVRPGEVLGLGGLMGAGRSETLGAIFGAFSPADVTGEVTFDGAPLHRRTPKSSITAGMALVAEDRKAQSLVLDGSVQTNTTLAALREFARLGWVQRTRERAAVAEQVTRLRVKTPGLGTAVRYLSGGNQQKVVLAKWLLTRPSLILLDEPTRGIDIGAKAEIYQIVADLAAQGVSFIVVSSELPELLGMSDRIVVLCQGRVTAELDAATATQEQVLEAAMPAGHATPPTPSRDREEGILL
ncbi:MAG: sugar ABC transporter ATP-binding protein [Arachnia sp.]